MQGLKVAYVLDREGEPSFCRAYLFNVCLIYDLPAMLISETILAPSLSYGLPFAQDDQSSKPESRDHASGYALHDKYSEPRKDNLLLPAFFEFCLANRASLFPIK